MTADSGLATLLANDDREGLHAIVRGLCRDQRVPSDQGVASDRSVPSFVTCYVINRDGIMVAHAPDAPRSIGGDFSWRDHFLGAKAKTAGPGGNSIHVSHVYRGRSDNLYKFAISAPIRDGQNNFLGTIATSVATDKVMGRVFEHDDRRKVALIAPTDISDPDGPRTGKHVILYHPGYRTGTDPVEFPLRDKIRMSAEGTSSETPERADPKPVVFHDDNYSDPVAAVDRSYAGRWIAGFAPVGNTGFMVVVQQRFEEAVSLEHTTLWSLALWSALASMVAVAILLIALWRWASSRKLEGAAAQQ